MITLYSKPNCPYCDKAKAWLDHYGFDYSSVDITADPDAREKMIAKGHKTVPQIYLGDRILIEGGWSGLEKVSPGELTTRINLRANDGDGW